MKGLYDLKTKILKAGAENCFISEITLAELKFGVENSQAKEKARLRKAGQPVDDFDLLIGATAISNGHQENVSFHIALFFCVLAALTTYSNAQPSSNPRTARV
jgi:hypothetical protein